MTFLLDANVLVDFQSAGLLAQLAAAAEAVDMAVAEQVLDEVTLQGPGESPALVGKRREAARVLGAARIRTMEILPGTAAAVLMQALLAPVRAVDRKDQGEAASVAIAASEPDLLFVTGDKTGVLWGLNELYHSGERVMRIPMFVRTLFERGALDTTAVRSVAPQATSHGATPSWWATWVASL